MKRLMIAAGGTGGHIYPALAVAHLAKANGWDVLWLGSRGRMEEKIVPLHYPIEYISMKAVRNKGWSRKLMLPLDLTRATLQAMRVMRQYQPECLLTMGGFVCAPAGLAAKCLGVPLIVHEQNAVPGLTNRLLKPLAASVLEAFSGTFDSSSKVRTVGNPVRAQLHALLPTKERLLARQPSSRLLVLGGSQGASALNNAIMAAFESMPEDVRPEVWHQTGENDYEAIKAQSIEFRSVYRVDAFIKDMANAYAWADLVFCRAGALTVSELASVGLASILVPLPGAVDNHQHLNAQVLIREQAAWLVPQGRLSPSSLADLLQQAFLDKYKLVSMGESARSLAPTDASRLVLGECEYVRQAG